MRIRKDKIVHPPVSWAVKGSDGVAAGASSSMLRTASFTCANISVVLYSHTHIVQSTTSSISGILHLT
jgi:hypothetical protein